MRATKILMPVVLLSALLASGVAFTPTHPTTPTDITAIVAAWNIEAFNPMPDDEMRRVARGLADLDAEVIALSEVNPDHTPDVLVAELQDRGAFYHRRLLDQTASQNLAILYKHGVEVDNVRLIPGSDDGNTGLRKALAVDVRIGDFDLQSDPKVDVVLSPLSRHSHNTRGFTRATCVVIRLLGNPSGAVRLVCREVAKR